jgi:hypothetical protein
MKLAAGDRYLAPQVSFRKLVLNCLEENKGQGGSHRYWVRRNPAVTAAFRPRSQSVDDATIIRFIMNLGFT